MRQTACLASVLLLVTTLEACLVAWGASSWLLGMISVGCVIGLSLIRVSRGRESVKTTSIGVSTIAVVVVISLFAIHYLALYWLISYQH